MPVTITVRRLTQESGSEFAAYLSYAGHSRPFQTTEETQPEQSGVCGDAFVFKYVYCFTHEYTPDHEQCVGYTGKHLCSFFLILLLSQRREQQTGPSGTAMTNVHTDEAVEHRNQDSGMPAGTFEEHPSKASSKYAPTSLHVHFHWNPQQTGSTGSRCLHKSGSWIKRRRTKLQLPIITFPQSDI